MIYLVEQYSINPYKCEISVWIYSDPVRYTAKHFFKLGFAYCLFRHIFDRLITVGLGKVFINSGL